MQPLDFTKALTFAGTLDFWTRPIWAESRCGAVAVGRTYLLPPVLAVIEVERFNAASHGRASEAIQCRAKDATHLNRYPHFNRRRVDGV
jgi:hypothetical protein